MNDRNINLKTVHVTMLVPTQLAQLDYQLAALVPRLAQLDDDQLLQLAVQARRLESCAFRLRGVCVAELRQRTARLAGGRGRRDTAGTGIKARLTHLAMQLNLSASTLKSDARIHEVFFTTHTGPACEPTLPRDYYVTALGAPDPLAAIRTAHERAADPAYNRAQFRRDVQALCSAPPSTTPPLPGIALQPTVNSRVLILPDAQPALVALIERTGQSPAEVVAAALMTYYEAQTTTPTRRRHSTDKAAPRLTQPPLPLS